jgi:hypothetical protein
MFSLEQLTLYCFLSALAGIALLGAIILFSRKRGSYTAMLHELVGDDAGVDIREVYNPEFNYKSKDNALPRLVLVRNATGNFYEEVADITGVDTWMNQAIVPGIYEFTTIRNGLPDGPYRMLKLLKEHAYVKDVTAQPEGEFVPGQAEGLLALVRESEGSGLEELFSDDNLVNGSVGTNQDRDSTLTSQAGA